VGTLSDVLKSIKSKLVILTPSAVSINLWHLKVTRLMTVTLK
jgi:hypothetical protein